MSATVTAADTVAALIPSSLNVINFVEIALQGFFVIFPLPELPPLPFDFLCQSQFGCAKRRNSLYGFAGLRVEDVAGIQCSPGVVTKCAPPHSVRTLGLFTSARSSAG